MTEKFALGRTVITRGALDVFETLELDPVSFLIQHHEGNWGDLGEEDKEENEKAIEFGNRILSAYRLNDEYRIYIITEHDRSITTILLTDEY